MIVRICETGKASSFITKLKEVEKHPQVKAIMILACDANGFTPESVDQALKDCPHPVMGGIFPQIIANAENMEKGTVIAGFFHDMKCSVVQGLSNNDLDLDDAVSESLDGIDCVGKTMFVFVDGLSTRISAFIEGMFNNIGLMPNYIGGGAGSLSFEQKPCLFSSEGLLMDAAILGVSDVASGIGVAHGWHPVSKAIKVTQSEKNKVISLNWEPALQVYSKTIEEHSGSSFADQDFFDIAKAYPLGIVKLDTEMVVRDPIMTEDNSLVCVGEVPEGSFVYILHGNMESLIQGAVQARDAAVADYSNHGDSSFFFMDCISRVLFMGQSFENELQAVSTGSFLFGALTLGEIANTGDSYLEFYNKTAVAGILNDPLSG
ncbi:FIST signal transduction protein [Desulfonatronovibrio magnus]|uniref:FIST signal transduction protein n=1 Tax=Desulfonatronovibrio magnus TaxID=698827 RepID=UPI0005EBC66B|nr:FIST C-terminal domain-containing protein [Desulfonatronovibrio magnus]